MKKLFLLLTLSLVTSLCFSQKLKENEIDEFTGKKKMVTSWENLCLNGKDYAFAKVQNYDGYILLHIKHMPSWGGTKPYSIDEGDKLMLMLDDGTVVTLYSPEMVFSAIGAGATGLTGSAVEGIYPTYPVNNEDVETLKSQPLKKVRMYTTNGYIEVELKGGKKEMIKNMLELVTEE